MHWRSGAAREGPGCAPEVAIDAREVAHDQLGAGQIAADVAEHLHDVVDARRTAGVRGARGGKAQHVLQFGRAARTGTGVAVGRRISPAMVTALSRRSETTRTPRASSAAAAASTRVMASSEMLEAHLGRAIGERDVEGLVGAGEQRFVDPDRASRAGRRPRGG